MLDIFVFLPPSELELYTCLGINMGDIKSGAQRTPQATGSETLQNLKVF